MGQRRSDERATYWQGVISRQQKSGQSIAAFCREQKISQPSFFSWRRRLAATATPQFVSVSLAAPPQSELAPSEFEIRLPDGESIVVPAHFDESSLQRLLDVVRHREHDDA